MVENSNGELIMHFLANCLNCILKRLGLPLNLTYIILETRLTFGNEIFGNVFGNDFGNVLETECLET